MINIMELVTDYNMVLVYCAVSILALLLLGNMTRMLRYLAVAVIAFIMWVINNPDVQLPSWILNLMS